ncbi:sialin-like [Argiope bruennichi]|uniref:sialin-like n=1 Tax=Argiope bruennichi TaxID=94029 RepID=UPI00249433E1|nr:sialin-like [Argiope bruennichi]
MTLNFDIDTNDKTGLVSPQSAWRKCLDRIPARYVLAVLGFFGCCNVAALRVNLSVAMVSMINDTAAYGKHASHECSGPSHSNSTEIVKEGEFNWTPDVQSNIVGGFFYGYVLMQIPGGRLAERFGGKWLVGLGIFCTSVLTMLTPVAARWDIKALIALRVFEGLCEGVVLPALHCMLGTWLPKYERSIFTTIIYSGTQIGTVIAMPISGELCYSDRFGGWPSVFYVFGALGCFWFIFWALFIHEMPEKHPHISKAELILIQTGKETSRNEALPIPWKSILTSVPVWILMITHFGQNWGFYIFLTELPSYLSSILHFNIESNGFLSAVPHLMYAIVGWIVSYMADNIRKKDKYSINTIRKVCNGIGFFGPAICLVGVILVGCDYVWSVVFLTLALGFNGCTYSGFMVTHVDMSPHFAGTLMGLSNGLATTAGFIGPKVIGLLTENNETLNQWRIIFMIAVAVYIVTGLLFVLFGSAKSQKWGLNIEPELSVTEKEDKINDVDLK